MELYNTFNLIAGMSVFIYNLLHLKKKKSFLSSFSCSAMEFFKQRGNKILRFMTIAYFWAVAETLIITVIQYMTGGFLNFKFGELVGTGANYFGLIYFSPLMVIAVCLLLKIDPLKQMDLITPAFPLALFFSKIGCFFAGCCGGIVFEHGIYNPESGFVEFPAQLLEAAVAIMLFIFFLCIKKKLANGTVFPVYLMLYSAIRFFTEFLRCEPSVAGPLKTYHILCCIGVFFGWLQYVMVQWYNRKKALGSAIVN